MRCTRTRMRSTECTYLQCLVFPPACPFSLNQAPNSDQSRRDAARRNRSRVRRPDDATQSRARHGPVTTVQSRRTGAVESNSRGLSLSKSIGRFVGHGRRRLAVSQHSAQAGCERIRPSMQVAVDGRRIARSPSSHGRGHLILTGPDLRLVPSASSALSVKPSSLTTSLSFSSHLSISLSTPPVLDGARQINYIDF